MLQHHHTRYGNYMVVKSSCFYNPFDVMCLRTLLFCMQVKMGLWTISVASQICWVCWYIGHEDSGFSLKYFCDFIAWSRQIFDLDKVVDHHNFLQKFTTLILTTPEIQRFLLKKNTFYMMLQLTSMPTFRSMRIIRIMWDIGPKS